MSEKKPSCAVRKCKCCGYQALVPDKPEGQIARSVRRRYRKFLQQTAQRLGIDFLEDGDTCPKCGNVATEISEAERRVHFDSDVQPDDVATQVKPLIGS